MMTRRFGVRRLVPSIHACSLHISLLATVVLVFAASTVRAGEIGIPDVQVQPADDMNGLYLAPGSSAIELTIDAKTSFGEPIAFATVTFETAPGIRWCSGAPQSVTTDEEGLAQIFLRGGGCEAGTLNPAIIRINGVAVRVYDNARSSDYDGSGGDGTVSLPDLISFVGEFLGTEPAFCHDYDDSGNTGIEDLVLFSQAFLAEGNCTLE